MIFLYWFITESVRSYQCWYISIISLENQVDDVCWALASNHRALGCKKCDNWIHIKCGGVTPAQYVDFLRGNTPCQWRCPLCDPIVASADLSLSSSKSFNLSDCSELSNSPTNDRTRLRQLHPENAIMSNSNMNKIKILRLESSM